MVQVTVPRGTRVLLTCDVEGQPEGNLVISYSWYQQCTEGKCEIREGEPYHTAVDDTLLVDTISWDGGRRYSCEVKYRSEEGSTGIQPVFTSLRLTG